MDSSAILHGHKRLIVWQKSLDLVCAVYALTEQFPREEIFCITSQMRRASLSIPSNIAEGRNRSTKRDFLHFLRIAFASGAELETQIEIAKRLPKTKNLQYAIVDRLLAEIMKMLNAMMFKMNL